MLLFMNRKPPSQPPSIAIEGCIQSRIPEISVALLTHDFSRIMGIQNKMKTFVHRSLLTGSLLLALTGSALSANQYVEITAYRANIRSGPATSASLVVTAHRGDVFELLDEGQNWYQLHLFSGEVRHLHKSLAQPISYQPEVPENTSLRRQIFQALNEAEERVIQEADRRFPPNTRLGRNLQYQTQLRDKYKLEVMHRLDAQPPVYRRISIEGLQKSW